MNRLVAYRHLRESNHSLTEFIRRRKSSQPVRFVQFYLTKYHIIWYFVFRINYTKQREDKTVDKNPAPFVNQWTKGKFNFRASFYTGRDPNSGDLNSSILEDIYQGIRKEFGDQKAKNFARFVATLGDLSASAFIQAFENFWW